MTEGADVVAIPKNVPLDPIAALQEWDGMQKKMKELKAAEMILRKQLFAHFFPNPKEGTNKVPLAAGWELKGGYTLDRAVDVGALLANSERFVEAGISADALVERKPSLVTSVYRTLTAEQAQLFDQCLIIKPGSPSLEIVLPAKAKKAGETI